MFKIELIDLDIDDLLISYNEIELTFRTFASVPIDNTIKIKYNNRSFICVANLENIKINNIRVYHAKGYEKIEHKGFIKEDWLNKTFDRSIECLRNIYGTYDKKEVDDKLRTVGKNFDEATGGNLPGQVFFNKKKKATTLLKNGKATVVKCGKGDKYSKRVGFLEAYFQMQSGLSKTQAQNYLNNILREEE